MVFLATWVAVFILVTTLLVSILALVLIIYFTQKKSKERIQGTQNMINDRDLLLMIAKEPDGMMTAQRLADHSGLTKKEANARLYYFYTNGLLKYHYSGLGTKGYYSLKTVPEDIELIDSSGKPYLTVQDILLLFKYHDYRLTAQQIIMSTGLPLSVINKELKYFKKEKIVELVYTADPTGMGITAQTYLLAEPYRSNPDKFMEQEETFNLELKKIYAKEYRNDELL